MNKADIVTFSYDSFSQRSVPINPVVFRIRTDLSWEQVVLSHIAELPQAQSLNSMRKKNENAELGGEAKI